MHNTGSGLKQAQARTIFDGLRKLLDIDDVEADRRRKKPAQARKRGVWYRATLNLFVMDINDVTRQLAKPPAGPVNLATYVRVRVGALGQRLDDRITDTDDPLHQLLTEYQPYVQLYLAQVSGLS